MTRTAVPEFQHEIDAAAARFSVFLSNRNHACFLPMALEAILAQSVQPREVYLVDDGSTDNSASIIRQFAARNPVIRPIFREQSRGFITNVIAWLQLAEDEYLYIAAADDVVLPGFFEKSLAMLVNHPRAGLCSAFSGLIDESGNDLGILKTPYPSPTPCYIPPAEAARRLMRDDAWFMGNTVIYRRPALQDVGGFDNGLQSFADGFACRAVALTHGACFLPAVLAHWRRMDTGMAGQTNRNVIDTLKIAGRAKELMTKTHVHHFPQGYARRWYGAVRGQTVYRRG